MDFQNEQVIQDIEQYRTMVFRIAYGYVRNTHDADDITQDVFLKLCKSKVRFADDEHKKAWLIRVACNRSKTLLTSAWRTRKSNMSDIDESVADMSDFTQDKLNLYEYVEGLKPKYRTIIYLYYYEEYTVKEIAGILKLSQTAVTTQLNRARGQLKEILLEEGFVQ